MEVGAVKQAFNNEVIHLKKKLNQAKIQTIHKLTRKAKTLNEKKAPDHLKGKLKRKAESAVNEVLLIKKIKPKDIAKFIITHTGKVNDYLNRPKVDNDKVCARLVLHKSLQDKYTFIRNRFGNIPIKDLFMSRQERRKIKAEAKEQQKNKKKGKQGKVTKSAGEWDIEDIKTSKNKDDSGGDAEISGDESNDGLNDYPETKINHASDDDSVADENDSVTDQLTRTDKSDDKTMEEDSDNEEDNNDENSESDEDEEVGKLIKLKPSNHVTLAKSKHIKNIKLNNNNDFTQLQINTTMSKDDFLNNDNTDVELQNNTENEEEVGKLIKIRLHSNNNIENPNPTKPKNLISKIETIDNIITQIQLKQQKVKETDKKVKENKNKNLKDKLQNRKFKKDEDESHIQDKKVVDPFFITATGENYLSLAEPRLPDEIKEVHKQGNRQERRAAMFGRKFKPRNDFGQNNFRSNRFDNDNTSSGNFGNKNNRYGNGSQFEDKNALQKFGNRNGRFNDRNSMLNDKNHRFNKFGNNRDVEKKDEKLHPSWEAKRKLKSMPLLPSQGKKIVFDDN